MKNIFQKRCYFLTCIFLFKFLFSFFILLYNIFNRNQAQVMISLFHSMFATNSLLYFSVYRFSQPITHDLKMSLDLKTKFCLKSMMNSHFLKLMDSFVKKNLFQLLMIASEKIICRALIEYLIFYETINKVVLTLPHILCLMLSKFLQKVMKNLQKQI